jgi:hypothetical protein
LSQFSGFRARAGKGAEAFALRLRGAAAERWNVGRLTATFLERSLRFDPAVLTLRNGTLLIGYFQSEKYFEDIAADIRKDFRPADGELSRRVCDGVAALRKRGRPLVSIHVRRGDYLSVSPDGALLVAPERIERAMGGFHDSDFLMFSDDMAWCKSRFGRDDVSFSPFSSALEDLMAMTLCDHNIIANSSFSWWGAWLNSNPQKRVVAPRNWFGRVGNAGEDADIYPVSWEIY